MEKVAVIGSSGLIGGHIVEELLKDSLIREIRLLVRRTSVFNDSRIKQVIVDFTNKQEFKVALEGCDHLFCAIGTTRKKTPNLKEYRKIDFDIPVTAAQLAVEAGAKGFHLVSAIGANSQSMNFYSKMKGEVEDAISRLNIPQIGIYQPSLLLGKRNEKRIAESISACIMPLFSFLIPSDYKPIQASTVARAMVRDARKETAGVSIYQFSAML